MALIGTNAVVPGCGREDVIVVLPSDDSSQSPDGQSRDISDFPTPTDAGIPSSEQPAPNPSNPSSPSEQDGPSNPTPPAPPAVSDAGLDNPPQPPCNSTEDAECDGDNDLSPDPEDPAAGVDGGTGTPPSSPQPSLPPLTLGTGFAFPAELQLGGTGWSLGDAFPGLFFDVATSITEAPGTGRLFVTQQNGLIYAISKNSTVEDPLRVVLDLSATTQGGSDCGLLGLAFHPEFGQPDSPNRGFMYVHRAFSPAPVQPAGAPVEPFTQTWSRLSRFTIDLDTLVADPASEQILIEQQDENLWHQGGALFFNPNDGFLYVSVGDEGDILCIFDNCQRTDKDLFSGVLRIDVDQRGGDISHPIPRQPQSGTTANYYIPNDNPFVGQSDALEEFYAIGLRSPHRMTYDPIDDLTIIGDVGQIEREELNVLARGANYQWNVREGLTAGSTPMSLSPIGIWTDPILDLPRQDATAIIGGYIYRGTRLPELWGKYIFGDFGTGNIWALSYEYDGSEFRVIEQELLLQAPPGLASFGVDADGELYLLYFGIHPIRRLERTQGPSNIPALLSELGLFSAPGVPATADALLPYTVQSPLWSDGAEKQRWVALPENDTVDFSEEGPWEFPVGTTFIKHFSIALDERFPEQQHPLETRFLVHGAPSAYYGFTYKWNADGTDAELLRERRVENLTIVEADGSVREQRYTYPSPADCLTCHTVQAGQVLGARTAQLNGIIHYESGSYNQIAAWAQLGLFGYTLDAGDLDVDALDALPRLASIDDDSRSLEDRVRSYWDSNCSMCHGVDPTIRANWDARFSTPLESQKVLGIPPQSTSGEGDAIIWPGDTERSVLFRRSNTTDPSRRMPPLGRSRIDTAYVDALSSWIQSLD